MTGTSSSVERGPALALVSSSGKRLFPRVDVPLAVAFDDGERLEVGDWSIAGFSLPHGGPVATEGAIFRVRLHLGLNGCEVVVEADAKVAWLKGGHARGFRFVALTPDKARILDHFIQSRLEGDAAVVGGLPVAHAVAAAPGRPGRLRRWTHNALQATKLTLLAGVVLGGAGYGVFRFLTVTTDYAAVSADLQQLHAPAAGFLQSEVLAVGTHLVRGQRIGLMQPVTTPQTRLAAETEISALQVKLDQTTAALERARAGFATFVQAARADLEEARAARAMAETQVAAEEKVLQRLMTLKASGVVAEARTDQEQQVLLTLQRSLSAARDLETAARQKLVDAEAGRFSSDGHATQQSPADIEKDVSTTAAALDRLKAMAAALDQPLPLLSPCDCTVASITATPGAFVATGSPLADLAKDRAGAVSVDALVQNPRLALLREGQDVTVYLANAPAGVPGRVTGINFNPANTGRTGLPAALRTLDDYGLMTVEVTGANARLAAGLPATILAPVGWDALAAHLPGADTAMAAARMAADGALSVSHVAAETAAPLWDRAVAAAPPAWRTAQEEARVLWAAALAKLTQALDAIVPPAPPAAPAKVHPPRRPA